MMGIQFEDKATEIDGLHYKNAAGETVELEEMTTLQDRAFGCMFGAFVGDSIGSFLEYF